jgi:hypothetical protein
MNHFNQGADDLGENHEKLLKLRTATFEILGLDSSALATISR